MGVRGVHGGAQAKRGDLLESKHGVRDNGVRLTFVGDRTTSTPLQERVNVGGQRDGGGGGESPGSVDCFRLELGGAPTTVLI